MSSLIISHDLQIIMLEIVVENLFVPWNDVLDEALMKKTTIMFRMLDDEWTSLLPNRCDYRSYRGSNYQKESFHGGKSILFSLPEAVLKENVSGVDVQFYVSKEVSKYFELDSRQNFGFTLVRVDDVLNGIIKDLRERKELSGYMSSSLERAPISRSLRGTYPLVDEDLQQTSATIELYIRISYLGKCIITEIHSPLSIQKAFYAREDTDEHYPYQFRELTTEELLTNCWGSATILSPAKPEHLICRCASYERQKALEAEKGIQTEMGDKIQRRAKFGKRGKRGDRDKLKLKELLELLKRNRRGRGAVTVGLSEKRKKICPPPISSYFCPSPCQPTCTYSLPCGYCPVPSQPFTYCGSMICPITCQDRV